MAGVHGKANNLPHGQGKKAKERQRPDLCYPEDQAFNTWYLDIQYPNYSKVLYIYTPHFP